MDSAVGFITRVRVINGDFETRFSEAQSKSRDRFSGSGRPPHSVPVHFFRPVRH